MADSIGQAYVQILPTTKGFSSELSSQLGGSGGLGGAGKAAGSVLGKGMVAGLAAVGVGAAAVAGITKSIIKGSKEIAEYGDNVDKMSQKIGISAEAYQEWDAVLKHSGANIESLRPSMKTLATQAQKNADEFAKLGISQEEVASLSQEELFSKTIEGLQNMGEGTERTAIAGKLLGRGATELGALLNTSADDTQKMKDRVHELGGVMSNEAVKDSAKFQDQLQDMQTSLDGVKRNLMANFLPGLTTVMGGLTNIFSGDTENGMAQITEGVNGVVKQITTILPQALNIGSNILLSLGESLVTNLPTIIPAIISVAQGLAKGLIDAAPKLLMAGMQVVTELAKGIGDAAPELIPAAVEAITEMAIALTEPKNLTALLTAALGIITGLAQGIDKAIPVLIKAMPEIINNIVSTLINLAPELIPAAVNLLVTLGSALVTEIPYLLAAVAQVIEKLIHTFAETDWGKIGRDILDGIKNGLSDAKEKLIGKIKEIADMLPDAVKKLLKIGSPSKVMENLAKWIPIGLAVGINKNAHYVDSAISDMVGSTALLSQNGMNINMNTNTSPTSYQAIYEAVKQGASDSQPIIILNNRVVSRELKGMGVSFA